jgi:hypothetical protein
MSHSSAHVHVHLHVASLPPETALLAPIDLDVGARTPRRTEMTASASESVHVLHHASQHQV